MIKRGFLFFFLSLNALLFSQSVQKDFQIQWKSISYLNASGNEQIPIIAFEDAVYNGDYGLLPYFRYDIKVEDNVESLNIQIDNQQFRLISFSNEQDLNPVFQNINEEILIKTTFKKDKNGKIARIEFVPIKKSSITKAYSLLTDFILNIEYVRIKEKESLKEFAFASESVMANGDWYKFKVDRSGIFKISGADLQNAGVSITNLDPIKISVYGFGGMLKEANADFRFPDIPELAIQVVDGNDGKFDANDYLLFYADGPDQWEYNSSKGVFEHHLNIYDRNAYYFVHIGSQNGKRIELIPEPLEAVNFEVNTFTDYSFIENETYNLIGSGRRWVGDKFEFTDSNKYDFNFDNLVSGSTAFIRAELVARSTENSSFELKYNTQSLGNISINKIPT